MNVPLRKVALALAALFAILLINANVVQVGEAKSLTSNPNNQRVLIDDYNRQRGSIIVDGKAVALSTATSDKLKFLRSYPGAALFAPLTGYFSLTLGNIGVENSENGVLNGDDSRISISFNRLSQLLSGRTLQGGNVTLTIDRAAQEVAAKALGNRKGAVVALNPQTGAIKALVSTPSYDPSLLTGHDSATIAKNFKKLMNDPNMPLLNRATQQVYPPGSTFKVITAAAALGTGNYSLDTQIPSPPTLPLPLTSQVLHNFAGETCGANSITLLRALQVSCNTGFAGLGLKLGAGPLAATARNFGFGSTTPGLGIRQVKSRFPTNPNQPQVALSSIGQFDVRATPLQMALVAATVANGGALMKPYVVSKEQGPDLKVLSTTQPEQLSRPISSTVAGQLRTMMEAVVSGGTGTAAQIPGVTVAGKTGTADTGQPGAKPDSWFIAFGPTQDPKVAIAVLVENGGQGGITAAPIAQQVMAKLLSEKP